MGHVRSHGDRSTQVLGRRAGVCARAGTAQRARAGTTPRERRRKRRTAHLVALLSPLGENDARKSSRLGLGLGLGLDLYWGSLGILGLCLAFNRQFLASFSIRWG